MAKVINDYTLEIGWSGSKVTKGLIAMEKRIDRVYKKQAQADKPTGASKARASGEATRIKMLETTERKILSLRAAQIKLDKTNEGYKRANKLIQGNINKVIAFQQNMKKLKDVSRDSISAQKRQWDSLGTHIQATKMQAQGAMAGGKRKGVDKITDGGRASLMGGLTLINPLTAAVAGLGFAVIDTTRAAFDSSVAFETLNTTLLASFGTIEAAGKEMEYVNNIADKFKVDAIQAGNAWAMMALSAKQNKMPMQDARDIFEGTTIAIRGFGLGTEDAKGAFRALNQIMSKGQITMDDFKNELAQRMPGAMGTLQKVLGVTSDGLADLFDKGEIGAGAMVKWSAAMAAMVTESGALDKALKDIPANLQQLNTEGKRAGAALFGPKFKRQISIVINLMAKWLRDITPALKDIGRQTANWVSGVVAVGSVWADVFRIIGEGINWLLGSDNAMSSFGDNLVLYFNEVLISLKQLQWFLEDLTFQDIVDRWNQDIDAMVKIFDDAIALMIAKFKELPIISQIIEAKQSLDAKGGLIKQTGETLKSFIPGYVPNPKSVYGDKNGTTTTSKSSTTNDISMTINGSPGMDVVALADEVMDKFLPIFDEMNDRNMATTRIV